MPASTPEEAAEKWEDKTSQQAWEDGLDNMDQSPAEGLAEFWGGSASDYSGVEQTWQQEVDRARSNNTYEQNTSGKGDKWMRRARDGARQA